MDENFLALFDVNMMRVGAQAENADDAIRLLGEVMAEAGYVEETYWQDVLQRERNFPTGLPTQPVAVAIPHADPDHVIRSGIAVGVFSHPLTFCLMGSNQGETLQVSLLFMLALKDFKQQTQVIRDLLNLIQSGDLLVGISQAQTPCQIMDLIAQTGPQ